MGYALLLGQRDVTLHPTWWKLIGRYVLRCVPINANLGQASGTVLIGLRGWQGGRKTVAKFTPGQRGGCVASYQET